MHLNMNLGDHLYSVTALVAGSAVLFASWLSVQCPGVGVPWCGDGTVSEDGVAGWVVPST